MSPLWGRLTGPGYPLSLGSTLSSSFTFLGPYRYDACFKKYNYHLFTLPSQTRLLHWDPRYIHLCTSVTVVVNLNMFPLSLQVLCFCCTFAIFQTAFIKCTCDTNKKTNHDGSVSYVFFARFILAIDQHASVARCAKCFTWISGTDFFKVQTNNKTFTFWESALSLYAKSPSKRAFENYKPQGLFSEFYGILINCFRMLFGISNIVFYIFILVS